MRTRGFAGWMLITVLALAALPAALEAARTHVVQRGETLSSIAKRYDIAVRVLAAANQLRDADLVRRGQKLIIPDPPGGFVEHRVVRGESLSTIAARYGVTPADIRAHNRVASRDRIVPGQILRIPKPTAAASAPVPPAPGTASPPPNHSPPSAGRDPRRFLPAAAQAEIDGARVASGRWRHIVIHHSATDEGSGRGMDRYHREERHMENGLAYHFVIGNGRGMPDGEIFVGRRWKEQLDGGHLAIEELNQNSIGICLVGDFERNRPSRRQLDSLEALIRALERRTALAPAAVTTHRKIHPQHTKCPGRLFPLATFLKRLQEP